MLKDLYTFAVNNAAGSTAIFIILVCSIFLDISKLPLNPWKYVGRIIKSSIKWFGQILNGDLSDNLQEIGHRLNRIETAQKEDRKKTLRRSVLRFADECRIGQRHSKEMFDNVLSDIDEYAAICRDTADPNSVMDEAITVIKAANHKCFIDNDYL